MTELFTIGYSSHSIESFIMILREYGIEAVADVRSIPYSQYKPNFNREVLQGHLERANMSYVFLGNSCGVRIDDPDCYADGKVDYDLVAKHPDFIEGLRRIRDGVKKYKIVLMCAEQDPLNCHRFVLICRNLRFDDVFIQHILANGEIEDHMESEKRLVQSSKGNQLDLFMDESDMLEEAYATQARKIAFKDEQEKSTSADRDTEHGRD